MNFRIPAIRSFEFRRVFDWRSHTWTCTKHISNTCTRLREQHELCVIVGNFGCAGLSSGKGSGGEKFFATLESGERNSKLAELQRLVARASWCTGGRHRCLAAAPSGAKRPMGTLAAKVPRAAPLGWLALLQLDSNSGSSSARVPFKNRA